jgi:hypothetical protein
MTQAALTVDGRNFERLDLGTTGGRSGVDSRRKIGIDISV